MKVQIITLIIKQKKIYLSQAKNVDLNIIIYIYR